MARRVLLVAGGLLIVVGAAIMVQSLIRARYAERSHDWPQVTGVISSSEFLERATDTLDQTPIYDARVIYEYEVDGKTYRSERVAFGTYASSDAAAAFDLVNRYSAGAGVTVYYDPADPSSAVLEPGVGTGIRVVIGIGAGVGVFGLILIFAAIRAQPARQARFGR